MCGIAGILQGAPPTSLDGRGMMDALAHRGPDGAGVWEDAAAGIVLCHRRLAVVDLSPAGSQPMLSPSGRYVAVFNGEIYNHKRLRDELEREERQQWRGTSDTEVLLRAVERWGIEATLRRLVGMFAIALWDRQDRRLHLVRDRIGEKPLYYGRVGSSFAFASELKALRRLPQWEGRVSRDALALYLRYQYVPGPHTIYEGIRKLPPGTFITLAHPADDPVPAPYWSAGEAAQAGLRKWGARSEDEALQQLEEVLSDAVRLQMAADVPLGAFLSGGIDSSTIVALMQRESVRPVRTFTIGFREEGYDEAQHAAAVARHLGTDHTTLYAQPEDALRVIPRLPTLYDEPFSDPSQIPTFLVAQLTRNFVTVSLSGDGGDELFGGYNRYVVGRSIREKAGWLPHPLRRIVASGLRTMTPAACTRMGTFCGGFPTPDRLAKLADALEAPEADDMHHALVSLWKEPAAVVTDATEPETAHTTLRNHDGGCYTTRMMFLDLLTYLPDDIMVKVDRAAMGVSLETRAPFLDHRVVEFAWQLPLSMKIRGGRGKWLLRRLLHRYVPPELVERPKAGFAVPLDSWLRGPLREWADDLLDPHRLKRDGFFRPQPIVEKWREHREGRRNWQYHIWNILMFQSWLAESREG